MSYGSPRYLYQNLVTAAMISPSSQATGVIGGAEKQGTGSAVMQVQGAFSGDSDLIYTVQIDAIGSGAIGSATFRWKTSDTAAGSWEATGVATSSSAISLNNGVSVFWNSGSTTDFALSDSWTFEANALYGASKLLDLDRNTVWRSGAFEKLTNGGFASATSSWGATSCTLDSVAGGESGNCLEITRTGGASQIATQTITTVAGTEYILKAYIKSGTSGDEAFIIGINGISSQAGTSSGSWIETTYTFVATGSSHVVELTKNTATAGTMLFDTVSCLERPALRIDLGSALAITTCLLQDTNLSSAAVLKLQGHTSDVWTSPSYTNTISIADPVIEYITESYRYWRIYIEDDDNPDGYVEIGEIYLGTYLQLTKGHAIWDTPRTYAYTGVENMSQAGVRRHKVFAKQAQWTLSYPKTLSNTDVESLVTMQEALINLASTGIISPLFVHVFSDQAADCFLMHWVNITAFQRQYFRYLRNSGISLELEEVVKV